MGSFGKKHVARTLVDNVGVPVVPGSRGLIVDEEMLVEEVGRLGFPVVLKATAGGGGMGQVVCYGVQGAKNALVSCKKQGGGLFGDDGVFVERFVEHARHVEIQVFGDGQGNVVALSDRDCSVQRRRQKVMEEAPSPHVSAALRRKMVKAAVDLCESVKHENAGTVEFIVDAFTGEFFFLEVNCRLQVEHGVTELVCGVDIVEWMIRQAAGQNVLDHVDIQKHQTLPMYGHAFECRVYAENPLKGYRPSPGTLRQMVWPEALVGGGSDEAGKVRIDTWARTGSVVSSSFDPLVGKVLVWHKTRKSAIQLLRKTLRHIRIRGVDSNLHLLRQVCNDDDFVRGQYTTALLETMDHTEPVVEVLSPGLQTSLQDYPGRVGYWNIGVSPSGAMDAYAMSVGNSMLGNDVGACAMEITVRGPVLKFHVATTIVLTGAKLFAELGDGKPVPWWTPMPVEQGAVLTLEGLDDEDVGDTHNPQSFGKISYLAVRGGFDAPKYLGSTSTFPTGNFGGVHGRFIKSGDFLPLEEDHYVEASSWSKPLLRWLVPTYRHHWTVGALNGPHGSSEFLQELTLAEIWETRYEVSHATNRLGVRLIGPTPKWTRTDGGSAGLHPSNLHDYTYAPGAVNFSGNTAIVLMMDGPSLGGFICPITVATCEIWKVAQARPGDTITFKQIPYEAARKAERNMHTGLSLIQKADEAGLGELKDMWQPWWVDECEAVCHPAILKTIQTLDGAKIVYRMSGDTHLLVEYGEIELQLSYRLRVHCTMEHLKGKAFILELCPGVRSLLIKYDASSITCLQLVNLLTDLESSNVNNLASISVSSRLIKLPLAFNDQWTKEAQNRYSRSVRRKAPYLPSNVEFVKRINGLDSIESVAHIMESAQYMVLGLGDVYLGAPCAVPVDPRHRMVTSKYNPARTYTPEGAVGIGGAYMCIYGMNSPGGYQLVGRTIPIWDTYGNIPESHRGAPAEKPWLLRFFDRVQFYLVSDDELQMLRERYTRGDLVLDIEDGTFSLEEHKKFLAENTESIKKFTDRQQAAFNTEREAWAADGEDADNDETQQPDISRTLSQSVRLQNIDQEKQSEYSVDVLASVAATVWTVVAKSGDFIRKGDTVSILESMKVEIEVVAPMDGVVKELSIRQGQKVYADSCICKVVAHDEDLMASIDISTLSKLYKLGVVDPETLVTKIHDRIVEEAEVVPSVFTSFVSKLDLVKRARRLKKLRRKAHLPLYGIPFAVKDNIDVHDMPTTAGCPSYAYDPAKTSYCVSLLEKAGAICIGKTNMDQFATGLVGCRSPYGTPRNPRQKSCIPGGSSSGSAVAVAMNLCSFSLGTDTAGSGRVPAALNGIVGLKPTRGRISTSGIVPACASLDCVSIFASNVNDADTICRLLTKCNVEDPWSRIPPSPPQMASNGDLRRVKSGISFGESETRIRIGVPKYNQLEFFGDDISKDAFASVIQSLEQAKCTILDVEWCSFRETGALLYEGPFVAERYAAVGDFLEKADKQDAGINPVVAKIILGGKDHSAASVFTSQERIQLLKKQADRDCWENVDVLMVPSIPKPYTLEDVEKDPLGVNSQLGIYTNFVNLMDLCAIAVPVEIRSAEVPRGVTFIAKAWEEELLINLAKRWERINKKALNAASVMNSNI